MSKTALGFYQDYKRIKSPFTEVLCGSQEATEEIIRLLHLHYEEGRKDVIRSIAKNAGVSEPYKIP